MITIKREETGLGGGGGAGGVRLAGLRTDVTELRGRNCLQVK